VKEVRLPENHFGTPEPFLLVDLDETYVKDNRKKGIDKIYCYSIIICMRHSSPPEVAVALKSG
jgi:hypothetical protein